MFKSLDTWELLKLIIFGLIAFILMYLVITQIHVGIQPFMDKPLNQATMKDLCGIAWVATTIVLLFK